MELVNNIIDMVKTVFNCSKCDAQFPKWSGRCLECGAWGTLIEGVEQKPKSKQAVSQTRPGQVVELSHEKINNEIRLKTNFKEFDQVVGGGLVKDSLILLGGDPGVGKSTLALQLAAGYQGEVLYVSAEESVSQVASRLKRLKNNQLKFLNEDKLEVIRATIEDIKPDLVVVDSIQTIYSEEVDSNAGSLNQVRACTAKLLELAKSLPVSIVVIGHVTKQGEVAGPKTMEHLVDTVLYLEGDKYKQYRLLRATKNRFGSTDEIGILEMTAAGLKAVSNPSEIFIAESQNQPGSVITAVREGSQVFLVEVQALVSKTTAAYPKRSASGFDQKRLELLTTVITKKTKINLTNFDVFLNLAGGLKLTEPALDLAVVASIISAYQDQALPKASVVFGEVGLGGEVRKVSRTKDRIKEALKLGFDRVILPYFTEEVKGTKLLKIKEIKELLTQDGS